MRVRTRIAGWLLLLAAAPATLLACAPAEPPSFVVITIDTARADRFGFLGNSEELTPNADRLARESTVFTDCVAPMGTTSPSHATLLTGLHPRSHGVRTNSSSLPGHVRTLAEILSENGYETGAFVSMKTLVSHGGLHQGFDVVSDPRSRRIENGATRDGRETSELAQAWFETISAGEPSPFFAWVHYYEPHSPYRQTSYSESRMGDYAGPFSQGISAMDFALGKWLAFGGDRDAIWTFYNGQVVDADTILGEFLDFLRSRELLSNTVVVVTSDHGQALGEHGHPGHGPALWQSVLHVPLLIWDSRDRTGRRVDERVGLIDLVPTILDLAGIPVPTDVQGRSLVPALAGKALGDRVYVSEIRAPFAREDGYYEPPLYEFAAFEGRYKLMSGELGSALYDIESDQSESTPLRPLDAPESFERLSQHLRAYEATTPVDATVDEVPDDVVEGLRALGYAQ